MKREEIILSVFAVFVGSALTTMSGETMSVQVKSAPLRDTPSFIAKVAATLSYGDRVEVLETRGGWMKVSAAGGSGWAHNSALSSKRIVLKSGQDTARARASSDELALAGKGFNSDVESEFKKGHRDIDFTWIDKMEKMRVSPAEMQLFLTEGGVTPKEGGAQ